MTGPIRISLLALGISLAGCINVPRDNLITSADAAGTVTEFRADCAGNFTSRPPATRNKSEKLDSHAIRVLAWNIYKGKRKGWIEDLDKLSHGQDLIILQEARLDPALSSYLHDNAFFWNLGTAFRKNDLNTGILVASRVRSDLNCYHRTYEPLIYVPKSFLISRFALHGTNKTLLVANIHAVNFSLGSKRYRAQLNTLEHLLSLHDGPLLVAGDFNTWNDERAAILKHTAKRLSLKEIELLEHTRSRVLGRPVDFIFYRGLVPDSAESIPVTSSDHRPLHVTFHVPG